ncbi:hypothetical protein BDN72DRAFT_782799, partial [Pluteus cervinus]
VMAITIAAQRTNPQENIIIKSDSQYAIIGLTRSLSRCEDIGWIGVKNRKWLEETAAELRKREAATILKKVKGHSGEHGNEKADELAGEGARKDELEVPNNEIEAHLKVNGAKLNKMTQALLYQGLLEGKERKIRRPTLQNLDIIRHNVKERTGTMPTDAEIWRSIGDKAISRNIRAFLWKAVHNAYKCGAFWQRITNYERRGDCRQCNTLESIEHILTECEYSGQEIIWELVEKALEKKRITWHGKSLGAALGCGMTDLRTEQGKRRTGDNRFYRIILSESVHLIWKIRCEWRISRDEDEEKKHTEEEIRARWTKAHYTLWTG